ncbi:SDR family oxidoreductase [Caldinitratiruptor microaerophilus]|uniref:Oxidoreductase n=1 Tax=Caldinitratiruptor microaerophilus TaxID=671077 RepID=A0AA35CMS0_9FIRM|nr:SDR family oxidoreductase [Caldinitratiruptor microaerophilus]BDG60160.1 putative oxidoreductase [Caldinitratiruptor microaerophilus]
MPLVGKVAVVTGAAQGIGRSIAQAFAGAGARVVVADVQEEKGRAVAGEVGGLFVRTDVSDARSVENLFADVHRTCGRVDVLVNNAGIAGFGSMFAEDAEERWHRVLGVNLTGAFLCARQAASLMKATGGGAIINISSTRAFQSEPDSEAYGASKAGLLGLNHALAVSLGRYGIRVNAICPGWIETEDYDQLRPEDHAQHPAGRVGRPEDIARAALFLADPDQSGFLTGQHIVIDGGMTVKMIYLE